MMARHSPGSGAPKTERWGSGPSQKGSSCPRTERCAKGLQPANGYNANPGAEGAHIFEALLLTLFLDEHSPWARKGRVDTY